MPGAVEVLENFEGAVEWFSVDDDEACGDGPPNPKRIVVKAESEADDAGKLLRAAGEEACMEEGAGVGHDICVCSRISVSFFESSYKKLCGECRMRLVTDDRSADREAVKEIQEEFKEAIKKHPEALETLIAAADEQKKKRQEHHWKRLQKGKGRKHGSDN